MQPSGSEHGKGLAQIVSDEQGYAAQPAPVQPPPPGYPPSADPWFPGEPTFRIQPSPLPPPTSRGLLAALGLAILVAIAGWTTAIVALVSGGDASAPSESGRPVAEAPAGPSPTTPAAPTLAEEPCGVAAATAEAQALTNIRSVPSATTDGTGSVRRLKLRCELSADELSLTVNLLRSTDAAAVKASFDFNRVASRNQGEGLVAPLPEVGKQAFTTTGRPSPSGRVVVAVDVLGTDRAISISATTSADYPAAKARDVLVALAKAHVTAP